MNRICSVCETENEEEYRFCKNCGALINDDVVESNNELNISGVPIKTSDFDYNMENISADGHIKSVDGIPISDLQTFVGKKSENFIARFIRFDSGNSKVSWCWPAAVLGFVLGPAGAAIWLFYRKMERLASIFATVGAVLLIAVMLLGEVWKIDISNFPLAQSFIEEFEVITENTDLIGNEGYYIYPIADLFEGVICTLTGLFCGLYGHYWYFKSACKKIHKYRNSSHDIRYYRYALGALGGTSGLALTFGIVICFTAFLLSSVIYKIIYY